MLYSTILMQTETDSLDRGCLKDFFCAFLTAKMDYYTVTCNTVQCNTVMQSEIVSVDGGSHNDSSFVCSWWQVDYYSATYNTSPWYNRTGWLGVKHQVIYLPTILYNVQCNLGQFLWTEEARVTLLLCVNDKWIITVSPTIMYST